MTAWRAMSERAAAAAALAERNRANDCLHAAAAQYRLAAEMLEQAVALRKTEGVGK
jgi:predicted nucleic acid-binding protein